ncbi:MAG: NlpC/P60 family protein [Bilifractor sp.]
MQKKDQNNGKNKKDGKALRRGTRLTAIALSAVMTFQAVPAMADKLTVASSSSSKDAGDKNDLAAAAAGESVVSDSSSPDDSANDAKSTSATSGDKNTATDPAGTDSPSSASAGTDSSENVNTDSGNTAGDNGTTPASDAGNPSDAAPANDQNSGDTGETPADVQNLPADDASEEAQEENSDKPEQTNEELMAQQHIVNVAPLEKNYRFYLVDRKPAFALEDTTILQDKADDAAEAGTLKKDAVAFILENLGDGWYYVESGPVRGFVRTESMTDDNASAQIVQNYTAQAEAASAETGATVDPESYYTYAKQSVSIRDNAAYQHSLATVYDRVVGKTDAVVRNLTGSLTVHSSMSSKADEIGKLDAGDIAYVLSTCGSWDYIESGDVRGFVKARYLYTGDEASALVGQAGGEDAMPTAEETVAPEDNPAFYYTYTSTEEGSAENPIRKAVLETAASCIGNPYVWGGTSLTNGCDCSGFVQTLFGLYGVSLPRTAEAQSVCGTQIPVSEAEAGDLIFFAKDGYVYHVALCTGNNTTIEAYGTAVGIIANTLDTAHAVWAVRVLDN